MKDNPVLKLSLAGLLIAIGIIIPMFSPAKIIVEPASFTLASHVAIFIAMFISPSIAVTVATGTTLGFFFGGFPLVVVLRAASHIVFALIGALYLEMHPMTARSVVRLRFFSFSVALMHAFCELVVVSVFYFGGNMNAAYYQNGFLLSVLSLVGIGTVIHSMIDFEIANVVVVTLQKQNLVFHREGMS